MKFSLVQNHVRNLTWFISSKVRDTKLMIFSMVVASQTVDLMEALEICQILERQVCVRWFMLCRRFYGFPMPNEHHSHIVSLGDLAMGNEDEVFDLLNYGITNQGMRIRISSVGSNATWSWQIMPIWRLYLLNFIFHVIYLINVDVCACEWWWLTGCTTVCMSLSLWICSTAPYAVEHLCCRLFITSRFWFQLFSSGKLVTIFP